MTEYFLDTSALAKRYLVETGAGWIRTLLRDRSHNFYISDLARLEMSALTARRQKTGQLAAHDVQRIRYLFVIHASKATGKRLKTPVYGVVALNTNVLKRARLIAHRHALRALDCIQLASALQTRIDNRRPLMFIASDHELLQAAQAEHFTVDNPLLHP